MIKCAELVLQVLDLCAQPHHSRIELFEIDNKSSHQRSPFKTDVCSALFNSAR